MPDLLYRAEIEDYIANGFRQPLERQRRELAGMSLETAAKQPDSYWEKHKWELAAIALLLLRRPWDDGNTYLAGSIGHIAKPKERDADYLKWAAPYAKKLAGHLTDTTQTIVAAILGKREAGEQLTPEERSLDAISSAERLERIAATETTGAAARGEFSAAKAFNQEQLRKGYHGLLVAYWNTEDDGRVCPICRPLDGTPYLVWSSRFKYGPPAHVMCRCWLNWRA